MKRASHLRLVTRKALDEARSVQSDLLQMRGESLLRAIELFALELTAQGHGAASDKFKRLRDRARDEMKRVGVRT